MPPIDPADMALAEHSSEMSFVGTFDDHDDGAFRIAQNNIKHSHSLHKAPMHHPHHSSHEPISHGDKRGTLMGPIMDSNSNIALKGKIIGSNTKGDGFHTPQSQTPLQVHSSYNRPGSPSKHQGKAVTIVAPTSTPNFKNKNRPPTPYPPQLPLDSTPLGGQLSIEKTTPVGNKIPTSYARL